MTLYNVHIYREMRLYFPGIEADSPEEAARIAGDKPTPDAEYSEDCDGQNLAALVDVQGDEEYKQSVTIDFEAERLRRAAPPLLEALQGLFNAIGGLPITILHGQAYEAIHQAKAAIAQAKGTAA